MVVIPLSEDDIAVYIGAFGFWISTELRSLAQFCNRVTGSSVLFLPAHVGGMEKN